MPRKVFYNIAHRGASGYRPENTVPSFLLAMELGTKMWECDVRFTRDKEIVVIHDATVDRTTDGTGAVRDFTYSQLAKLDAGSWFSPEFAGARIPTLGQVLELFDDATELVVEIKDGIYFSEITDAVVEMVIARGLESQVHISAFHWQVLDRVKALTSKIRTSALVVCSNQPTPPPRSIDGKEVPVYTKPQDLIADALAHDVDILCPPAGFITEAVVEQAHAAGLLIRAWGLKGRDEQEMARLVRCGVNGMTTNYPDVLEEIYRNS